jgi:hypothetical protein
MLKVTRIDADRADGLVDVFVMNGEALLTKRRLTSSQAAVYQAVAEDFARWLDATLVKWQE